MHSQSLKENKYCNSLLIIFVSWICLSLESEVLIDGRRLTILDTPARRIVQGWPAKIGDVPYMVSFKRKRTPTLFSSFCGGALIAPRKILTAVHCFYKRNKRSFIGSVKFSKHQKAKGNKKKPKLDSVYAVMGSFRNTDKYAPDENGTAQWRALQKFNYLRNNKRTRFNDLGLVFTVHNFDVNNHVVSTVPYATKRENYVGACTICGFGAVKRHTASAVLMLGHVHLVDDSECKNMLKIAQEQVVCGALDSSHIGRGDSGGPLVCKGTGNEHEDPNIGILVGVSSAYIRGKNCMFTRVSTFAPFIESTSAISKKTFARTTKAVKRINKAVKVGISIIVMFLLAICLVL